MPKWWRNILRIRYPDPKAACIILARVACPSSVLCHVAPEIPFSYLTTHKDLASLLIAIAATQTNFDHGLQRVTTTCNQGYYSSELNRVCEEGESCKRQRVVSRFSWLFHQLTDAFFLGNGLEKLLQRQKFSQCQTLAPASCIRFLAFNLARPSFPLTTALNSEYNPPQFLIDAHKRALQEVENNQYGPVTVKTARKNEYDVVRMHWSRNQGMPIFKEALSKAYSPEYGRTIDPDSEISVTTGATEGLLSSVMAFVEPGDEVILMEPVFDL